MLPKNNVTNDCFVLMQMAVTDLREKPQKMQAGQPPDRVE